MAARLYRESAATLVIEATPPGRRSVVVTIVDQEVAVLEFRQDWGQPAEADAGLGGFDVVPYRSEEQLGELLRPWVTAV
ncbi:hypothetical protein [Citricoccus nitrophenolicus]|uniref:hypothetical protein n=1 Tax=Citricoccus nitrophenolicus TaxID=863575 RepID=UPI0039B36B32